MFRERERKSETKIIKFPLINANYIYNSAVYIIPFFSLNLIIEMQQQQKTN